MCGRYNKRKVGNEPENNNLIIFDEMVTYLRDTNVKSYKKNWLWTEGIITQVFIFYVKPIRNNG